MRATLEVDTSKFEQSCDNAKKKALKVMQRSVAITLINTDAQAKLWCPVDTGRLRASIKFRIYSNGLGGIVGTTVGYGAYVELGTIKMRARPFLFPAFDQQIANFPRVIAEEWLREAV